MVHSPTCDLQATCALASPGASRGLATAPLQAPKPRGGPQPRPSWSTSWSSLCCRGRNGPPAASRAPQLMLCLWLALGAGGGPGAPVAARLGWRAPAPQDEGASQPGYSLPSGFLSAGAMSTEVLGPLCSIVEHRACCHGGRIRAGLDLCTWSIHFSWTRS